MSVYSTEGKPLIALSTCSLETIVSKAAIITMIVLDLYFVVHGKSFKACLSLQSLNSHQTLHEVNVLELRVLVNKDDGISITDSCQYTLGLGSQTSLVWQLKLVHQDAFARLSCSKDEFLLSLVSSWLFGHCTKYAAGTSHGLDIGCMSSA